MDVHGRIALVTGAARGLGAAVARTMAAGGAKLVVCDLNEAGLARVAEELRAADVAVVKADLSRPEECRRAVGTAVERFGALHILINNAAICPLVALESVTEELWDQVLGVNLKGAFFCAQAAIAPMRAAGWGRIVNVASGVVRTGGANDVAPYAASKGGLVALTKALARYGAPHGILTNAVAPGPMTSDMTAVMPADIIAQIISAIPLHRMAAPAEVAEVIRFLASTANTYVNGHTLDVNGGMAMN